MPRAVHRDPGQSWMSPAAKSIKYLLYVSNINDVYVYDYKTGKQVGTLSGFESAGAQCVDADGNVYVVDTDAESVWKFKRGTTSGSEIITGLATAIGCSVSRSGDVAVSQFEGAYEGAGSVKVFKPGMTRGTPYTYSDFTWGASYDPKGNLFAEGADGSCAGTCVFELPAGSSTIVQLSFNETIYFPDAPVWDGKYIDIVDQEANGKYQTGMYQALLSGTTLTGVGETLLTASCAVQVVQPFVVGTKNTPVNTRQGKTVVGGYDCSTAGKGEGLWKYPKGGNPAKTLAVGYVPAGQSLSIAK